MTTTEALRTKQDGLQWEVNSLDANNRRLRDASEDASQLVDVDSELEQQVKQDFHTLTEQLKECCSKLAEPQRGIEESVKLE